MNMILPTFLSVYMTLLALMVMHIIICMKMVLIF
nr:MAG TPA: hypothetical protein [Caudoviricetes sp.]